MSAKAEPPSRRTCAKILKASAAAAVLCTAAVFVQAAHAAGILSQGSLAAAPSSAGLASSLLAQQQGGQVGAQAQNQLSRITAAMQAMQNMQTAARNLSLAAPSSVPAGLQSGGLVPDSGLAASGIANPVTSWSGAQTPTQSSAGGVTTVTISQTAAQAILSWNSFNVSRGTTVDFNQQGNASWVALNKIAATGVPSQILGSIKASGQIYLINQNGIIFGGSSQINVGALIASSAEPSDSQFPFAAAGIYGTPTSFSQAGGAIIVQPGALISTNAPTAVVDGGGYVLLLGTTVQNAGSIATPDGQAELAAGDNFTLRQGYGTTNGNTTSTTNGNEIAVALTKPGSSLTGGSGLVVNTGSITSTTGDITLAGETVEQNGLALATTSVSTRGTIHLLSSAADPDSSVTLGASGYTLVEPDLSSMATAYDSQRAAEIASSAIADAARAGQASALFDDLSLLPDAQDESRIEIVTGGSVEFQNGSDTVAPGGQIAVSAASRVQADDGAILDVSGSYAVPMAMSSNAIQVNIQANVLRDNPLNRLAGGLTNGNVYVDANTLALVPASAADASARDYTQGGLLEVSGYLATTGHTIGEYTAIGGSIDLATASGGDIVAQDGSSFDIAGGSLQYQGGELPQSYLVASDGQIYNVNDAPADLTYTCVYGGFTVAHPAWGVSQVYNSPLGAPAAIYVPGYTVGRAAGSLTLSSPTTIFNGTIQAGTVNGPGQTAADPAGVTDPYTLTQNEVADPGTLNIATLNGASLDPADTSVSFGTAAAAGSLSTPIAADISGTSMFDAGAIDGFGLGGLTVVTNGSIAITAPLSLAAGGQVALYGSSVAIGADVTVPGGTVTASQIYAGTGTQLTLENRQAGAPATGDTVLAPNTVITTAGLFTNLALDPSLTFTQAFINGGAVSLGSVNNLTLGAGSLIDTGAGGVVSATGAAKGGAGGAISLAAATPSTAIPSPVGDLTLGGALDGMGYTKGGALTLSAPAFLISASPAPGDPSVVTLDPAFFAQGFSAYNLLSTGDITVAPGTVVNVTEPTYQVTAATAQMPAGTAPGAAFGVALDPLYSPNVSDTAITQRAGASFSAETLVAGNAAPVLTIGAGAVIAVDPGQSITLSSASLATGANSDAGQITIYGSLLAPGGTISAVSAFSALAALPNGPGTVSIWLGGAAVLDASAQPVSFSGADGATISLAPSGGNITLGSQTSAASVIISQGALVEAAGAAATDEIAPASLAASAASALPTGRPIAITGSGGAITLASQEGIYNDGTLTAPGGGAQAAGGSLTMILEADQVLNASGAEATPRLFTITQNDPGAALPANLEPGEASPALADGTAQISARQITAGGFGSVTLFARDAFVFQGDVSLSAGQSISLQQGYITDSSPSGSVALNAPYVTLSGATPDVNSINNQPLKVIGGFSTQTATGAFTVNADVIRADAELRFGGVLPVQGVTPATDLAGFGTVDLNASGDLQFAPSPAGYLPELTSLVTAANVSLTAREIYAIPSLATQTGGLPTTSAEVVAGYDPTANVADGNGNFYPDATLTIGRAPGSTPAAPDLAGGELLFDAPTIAQGGVIWQPLGAVAFGALGSSSIGGGVYYNLSAAGDPHTAVTFLPGSFTVVSAAGLTLPFGGTTDGATYDVDGLPVQSDATASFGLRPVTNGIGTGTITVAALNTSVQSGATLDLSGGGTLTGAGFISGEGGSVDVLTSPLLSIGGSAVVSQPSLATNPVYAIVTGPQPTQAVAYTESGALGSTPALGASIVIPAGVPGLPAGTYTLLPAAYALNPGGYRVEIDGAAALTAAAVSPLADGSYDVAGFTTLAGTGVRAQLPASLTITPGATVLNDGQYDQESYSQFLVATAARLGGARPVLPIDAGTLVLNLPASSQASLFNQGTALLQAAPGGEGGTLQISGPQNTDPNLDIYGAAPTAGLQAGTVSLGAAQIDAFGAATIELGAAGQGSTGANIDGVTLENGADLTAARVIITATTNGITLDSGAEIDTLGQGTLLADSTTLGLFSNGGASVLDVGNGYLAYGTAPPAFGGAYGPITVENGATIYTDGSIAFSTSAAVNIGVGASYGGAYLDLAVPEINIGEPSALGATAPAGLPLTQAVLEALTRGVPGAGVPAVKILDLTAFDSLNFYGTTALDLSGANVQLVINTPAIYGYGGAGDTATISASTIVWNGIATVNPVTNEPVSSTPGGVVANGPGTGSGTLTLDAQNIIFGYSSLDLPQRDVPLSRLALGFATVNIDAGTEITANNQGSLAVYQSQSDFGQPGTGGTLNLAAPLLTAADAATIGFTAGGAVNVLPPAGSATVTALPDQTAGGEIDVTAADINIGGAVILPSGKLNLQATGDIILSGAANLDLAGATTTIGDQTINGFGGDLVMASSAGDITADAGSIINVGAAGNDAGAITITADAAAAGQVALAGTLSGAADNGYQSGSFTIAAQSVGDFAALNASLDAGQFFQSRGFDIGQGDLNIGDGVRAHQVSVSLDDGSLTVTGLIDASGGGGGAISLAASGDLTIAPTAALEAQGTTLVVDSYGDPIASANAPTITLTATSGELTLGAGARLDLSSADGVARGDLELNVPRLTSATSGDANISAAGTQNIAGAATIAVNAFWTYNGLADPSDPNDGLITQAYLDQINTDDTQPFMAAAASNADLSSRLSGLAAYGKSFNFRPGLNIVSATADGDLTVEGDLDLLAYRYGAGVVAGDAGTGEPGVLRIRAGGNLNIYGSITDGFEDPITDAGTEFAKGWAVYGGGEPFNQNQTLPVSAKIAAGSSFSDSAPVNFAVPITGGSFQAGAIAPVALTVQGAQTVSIAFVATSAITSAKGKVLFAPGQIVPAGSVLPNGAVIARFGTLPIAVNVGPVIWPANTPFTVTTTVASGDTGVQLASKITLPAGAFIPAGSALTFVGGQPGLHTVNGVQVLETRVPGADGSQGQLYGLARLLPAGDQSWSISLVAGADTAAANPDQVRAASALGTGGNLILADTHYGISKTDVVPAFSVVRTGTGDLTLAAGGSIEENSAFGVYTAGVQSAAILNADGQNPYNLAQGYGTKNSLLGNQNASLAALVTNYAANYPTQGGNVLIDAQGNLDGFIDTNVQTPDGVSLADTDAVGNWLWRQGGASQPGAWWIEYGSLNLSASLGGDVQYTGFEGIGTLGGGNLTVNAGGDASGLNLAVASNGRVQTDGALAQNGGGTMAVAIGGALNFLPAGSPAAYTQDGGGVIADLRGDVSLAAGSIGTVLPQFGAVAGDDTRVLSPLSSETADFGNGIDLMPGDGTITVASRGDLVIDGAGNPGTVQNVTNTTPVDFPAAGISLASGGKSDFSLWTPSTGIDLFSAGGDVAPVESNAISGANTDNATASAFYPPNLGVTAQNGDIYVGVLTGGAGMVTPLELAPAPDGQLALLAAGSVIGFDDSPGAATDPAIIAISGAPLTSVATPFNPGINVYNAGGRDVYNNYGSENTVNAQPIDFGNDTPSGPLHAGDAQPALVYAGTGDILNIEFGAQSTTVIGTQLITAAKPFDIYAGRDIVDSGTIASPDIFLNLSSTDITSIAAGRDIIESSFDIAGPGNLTVQAGRDIYLADQGVIDSIGPLFDINPNDRDSGASVSVLAGVGAGGPDYANFANLFLNPASVLGLSDSADILQADDAALYDWLRTNYGYAGAPADAYADFVKLSGPAQAVFLRQLYFTLLNSSGLEFNQADSPHYKSYILGRDAIAALFPTTTATGLPVVYSGDLTMYGGSGIHTEFGGNIEALAPGGQAVLGVEGVSPPASAGFITQGSGDIDIYALGSVLLGESRVLTTFGGNILIWSAQGDINAGRGSKTSIDYTPLQRVYDQFGDVFLSPTTPSSGAGIATLNPIPAVPPGDIDLVAPVGTVDAGSAGIRVSGNLNIAAAHVANGANIQVQGSSTGVPTAAAPDVGALTTAGAQSGAAAQASESTETKPQAAPLPSIWIVEILGYSGETPVQPKKKQHKV